MRGGRSAGGGGGKKNSGVTFSKSKNPGENLAEARREKRYARRAKAPGAIEGKKEAHPGK